MRVFLFCPIGAPHISIMKHFFSATLLTILAGTLSAQAIFTSSGPFTVPAGVTSITVELVGAGGNGASNGGGGGGGGGYARGTYTVNPGATLSIVVGEGGSELATIVGGLGILAGAGENATTVSNPNIGGGGAGGVGQGGQVTRTGGAGGGGYYTYFGSGGGGAAGPAANGGIGGNTIVWTGNNCLTPGGAAGSDGGAPAGDGGKGAGFTDNNCSVTNPAGNGMAYGGGGGGGNGIGSPVGIGGGGICIVSWSGSTDIQDQQLDAIQLVDVLFTDRIAVRNVIGAERFDLLDATGRTLWSGLHIAEKDFSFLGTGAYFLRVALGNAVRTFKLVK